MRVLLAAAALVAVAGCGGGSHGLRADDVNRIVELAHARLGGQVLSVAWSSDGQRLAAGGPQGVVAVDPSSARRRLLLRTGSQVWGVAWRHDRDTLAAGTEDGRVWIVPGRFLGGAKHRGPAFSVSWSDNEELAVGYADGVVRVLGSDRSWRDHTAEVIAVAWSHEDQRLASGSINTSIVVRDGRSRLRFGESEGADVNGLAWSPGDERLAAANQDGVVRVWDVARRKVVLRLRGHEGWTRGVDWSPNGKLIASSGADGTVRIWDAEDGKELKTLKAGRQEAWSVAWSPDGKRLAAGDGDGTVRIWGLR
jgi:WD40 repeat protein